MSNNPLFHNGEENEKVIRSESTCGSGPPPKVNLF